jgi:hypothetical protein
VGWVLFKIRKCTTVLSICVVPAKISDTVGMLLSGSWMVGWGGGVHFDKKWVVVVVVLIHALHALYMP